MLAKRLAIAIFSSCYRHGGAAMRIVVLYCVSAQQQVWHASAKVKCKTRPVAEMKTQTRRRMRRSDVRVHDGRQRWSRGTESGLICFSGLAWPSLPCPVLSRPRLLDQSQAKRSDKTKRSSAEAVRGSRWCCNSRESLRYASDLAERERPPSADLVDACDHFVATQQRGSATARPN